MSLYEDLTLLNVQELLHLPPPKWLMENIIPDKGFVGLYGAPENGKSFIALDWALCIASGRPWLGRYPVKTSPTVYVAAEGGRGIRNRVAAWMRHYGAADVPGAYFLLNPLYVREEGTVENFLDMLEERDIWPGLIILDTLSRSFGGGEENASADMGHFVDQITRLAAGRYMAALVVHHKNATGVRERGSTAFRGATDAMFSVDAVREKETGHIILLTLKNDKQKDAERTPDIYLEPVTSVRKLRSLVFQEAEAPPKKEKSGVGPGPMRKVDMLTYLGGHPEGLSFTEWVLGCQVPKRTFIRRIKALIKEGEIYKENGRYFVMPTTEDLIDEE